VFQYSGMADGFRTIVRQDGWRGLTRGMDAAVPRVMAGSAAQLSSYSSCKQLVQSTGAFTDELHVYFASSLVAG
jgi:solute carrier family 25, member 34/35